MTKSLTMLDRNNSFIKLTLSGRNLTFKFLIETEHSNFNGQQIQIRAKINNFFVLPCSVVETVAADEINGCFRQQGECPHEDDWNRQADHVEPVVIDIGAQHESNKDAGVQDQHHHAAQGTSHVQAGYLSNIQRS